MTLLSLGKRGYLALTQQRLELYNILKSRLMEFADEYNCSLVHSKWNPISMALILNMQSEDEPTKLGSMLYTRGISGTRVVAKGSTKTIDGYVFKSKFML